MKSKCYWIIPVLIFVISCEKDKLQSDKSILIGKWNWIYTEHSLGWCASIPNVQFETITPLIDSKTYQVEFLERGKILFYENSEIIQKNRIVFEYFELLENGEYHFYIRLDDKHDQIIGGTVIGDSLRIKYPYIETDPGCENYLNFFVRE